MCPGQRTSTSVNTSSLAANQGVSCRQGKCPRKTVSLFPSSSTPPVQRPVWRPEIKCKVNVTNIRCFSHTDTELRPCAQVSNRQNAFLVFIVASSYIGFLYQTLRSLQAQAGSGWTHFRLQHSATCCDAGNDSHLCSKST